MNKDRFSIPQDAEYFHAIGLATIAFARLEWNAVWCCERLDTGYIKTVDSGKKTGKNIADDLEELFWRVSDIELRTKIIPFTTEFIALVKDRNGLMHGKPATVNGKQRLTRHGSEWTIDKVNEFSDRCASAAAPLGALIHAELKEPCQVALNPKLPKPFKVEKTTKTKSRQIPLNRKIHNK
jgi:hypothetical protein